MKRTALYLSLATIAATTFISTSAHAVYNLYKKDGLSLDVNGEVNVYATSRDTTYNFDYPSWAYTASNGAWVANGAHEEWRDRQTRLGYDNGSSWLEFRGSQRLDNGYRVTGTVGFGYWDGSMYSSNASLAVDKQGLGSLSFGRQYLHTGYVTRTGTYTPLDTFAASSVRLDYTGIPNFQASAYYIFPSIDDVRRTSNSATVEGAGVSASYLIPFADNHSVRLAAGYSDSKRNPATTGVERVSTDSKGGALSVEYRVAGLTVAADVGQDEEEFDGNYIRSAESNYYGAKIGYDFTPRINLTAGYGVKNTEKTTQDGVTLTAAQTTTAAAVRGYETVLFDEIKQKRAYVTASYYLRENFRLFARADQYKNTYILGNTDFSRLKDTEIRGGVSFMF
ncbi:MAG: hypothetical protein Q4D05_02925 [Acinetobacter sp.]|nr:hypothetical protein [Acinetobacter sp.]